MSFIEQRKERLITYPLYDEKGSCEICSTSTVKRRVDRAEFKNHAQRHIDAGDPVLIQADDYLIENNA